LERKEFSSSTGRIHFPQSPWSSWGSASAFRPKPCSGGFLWRGVDYTESSQSQDTHQSHSEQSYFCSHHVPHQLRLSDAALRELQDMEKLLRLTGEDKPTLLRMCESFFSRFGSSRKPGSHPFGGIFWWKASTEGFRAEQWEEMKRQTCEALNSFVSASFRLGVNAAGAMDVFQIQLTSLLSREAPARVPTQHSAPVVKQGAPPDTASLPQWKMGLVSDNTTWRVIDRGFQLIPVWDIILCSHSRDFQSVTQMSRALRAAYKALTNQSIGTAFGEELGSAVQEAKDFMEIVKTWEVTVDERKVFMLMELKRKKLSFCRS
uniref:Uncharacterized protein n=1 Tax=Malurus cyaneus samueli TaxID=2593467 RepID=A0A8C5TFL1_9PASS